MGNQGRNRPNKGPRHEGGGRQGGGGGGHQRDRDGNRDPNYRPNNGGARPDDQPPEVFEVDASEIISQADLAASRSSMNLSVLKAKPIYELVKMAETMGVEGMARSRKQDIIFGILKAHSRLGENIYGDGVLEILQDGFGFLRSADGSYLAGPDDIYVSPSQIRRFNLRTGDTISGLIRPPKDGERYFALLKVGEINFDSPDSVRNKVLFENLTPFHPTKRLKLRAGQWFDRRSHRTRHRPGLAHRQGPARSHRLAAESRQDHAAAEHRHRHHG